MSRPKAGEPYAFKTPEGVLYWHPPARRGAGGGEGPGYHMEPCTTNEGMVWLGTGSHRFLAPVGLLRAVVADLDGDAIATLTRERDELERLCAQLQAKANEVPGLSAALDEARGPVRLAQPGDVAAAAKAHEDAQAEREAAERRESEAWTALRNARGALHDATEVSAILAAQQPTLVEPTRPEPRFKVGDWVRVQHHGTVYQIGEVADPFGLGTLYFREKPGPDCTGQSWAAVALNPALDPALHETARATILLLGYEDARPLSGYAFNKLPGAGEWQSGKLSSADWAVQLERLLGDAP